ncbi:MAG: 4Fe-4S binding protein [Desulfohalobiaceae bacterium]|nr:4Fe-4S binding protein [Desulfohalobiaceae bacterium]
MSKAYEKLAQHLDHLPGGFPRTESGVELRILERLFSPEEAELAASLAMIPETAKQIAERLGEDADILADRLDSMANRGLIFRSSKGGQTSYMAIHFVMGIWEYQVQNLDQDLIRDVNEYLPYLMNNVWATTETKQLRVVPVAESLEPESEVMPYDKAEELVASQSKIVLAPCICRKEHAMLGRDCGRSKDTCLIFGSGAYFYEENGLGRPISQEEAKQVLRKGLEEGLVLQPGNSRKPVCLCLCCGCCCQVLKNIKVLDRPAEAVHTNFVAEVDPESCTACAACESMCQMEAIAVGEETAAVDRDRCIGCGLCVHACEYGAVRLAAKERQYEPPKNVVETYTRIARERGLM